MYFRIDLLKRNAAKYPFKQLCKDMNWEPNHTMNHPGDNRVYYQRAQLVYGSKLQQLLSFQADSEAVLVTDIEDAEQKNTEWRESNV